MRLGVFVVLGSVALAVPAEAHDRPFFWSVPKVMRAIDGVRLPVGRTAVRINAESSLCTGEGKARRRRGVRQWRHFWCTYTTFTRRGIGRDVEFRVHVLGVRRAAVTDARWIPDAP
jgi:hypothetical protein